MMFSTIEAESSAGRLDFPMLGFYRCCGINVLRHPESTNKLVVFLLIFTVTKLLLDALTLFTSMTSTFCMDESSESN